MAAFYLKGVRPPHVTLNQIFAGMMPFMGIQVLAIFLLYIFPADRPVAAAAAVQVGARHGRPTMGRSFPPNACHESSA